jgi:hypothetical protein
VDISQEQTNKKPRIHKIHSTEFEWFKKLKCPSEHVSVPLGKEKKAVTSGKGSDLRGKVDGEGEGEWERGEPDLVLDEGPAERM